MLSPRRAVGTPPRNSFRKRRSGGSKSAATQSRGSRIVTALDAPASVRRVLEDFNPAALCWADPDHRYVIVRESLVRGDRSAVQWLRSVLPHREIRELVRRNRGTGCNETERQRLRKTLRLSPKDIPVRPL